MAEVHDPSPLPAGAPPARPGSLLQRAAIAVEKAVKEPLFDCRMCGQCILHSTGLVCPMRCPKNLRNGPCGGVLVDGHCEVFPDRPCIWVMAWEQSRQLPIWRGQMTHLNPPVDWRLQGTSSWMNLASGRDHHVPAAWPMRRPDVAGP
ncbi:MAG: methylenetetrahydrofolate reductase C-terminal domain-containing protein [Acidobacteriota bacterium]